MSNFNLKQEKKLKVTSKVEVKQSKQLQPVATEEDDDNGKWKANLTPVIISTSS